MFNDCSIIPNHKHKTYYTTEWTLRSICFEYCCNKQFKYVFQSLLNCNIDLLTHKQATYFMCFSSASKKESSSAKWIKGKADLLIWKCLCHYTIWSRIDTGRNTLFYYTCHWSQKKNSSDSSCLLINKYAAGLWNILNKLNNCVSECHAIWITKYKQKRN